MSAQPEDLDRTPAAVTDSLSQTVAAILNATAALGRGDVNNAVLSLVAADKALAIAKWALEYALAEVSQ